MLRRRQAEGYICQFQIFIAFALLASLKFPIALIRLGLEAGGRSNPQLALAINTAAILGLLRLHIPCVAALPIDRLRRFCTGRQGTIGVNIQLPSWTTNPIVNES